MPGITTGWKLYVSAWTAANYAYGTATVGNRPVDAVELTDRLIGAEVEMTCGIGEVPTGRGVFVLNNDDGLYTPTDNSRSYDDDITYDRDVSYETGFEAEHSWEWFRQPVFLVPTLLGAEVEPGTAAGWFSGFCTDVKVEDDGYKSTVTLIVEDWFTFASRYTFPDDLSLYLTAQGVPSLNYAHLPDFLQYWVLGSVPGPVVDADTNAFSLGTYSG